MVPSIPMGCTTLSHSLDEDAQLLQAHVCSGAHANDADAQALRVCEAEGGEAMTGRDILPKPMSNPMMGENYGFPPTSLLPG